MKNTTLATIALALMATATVSLAQQQSSSSANQMVNVATASFGAKGEGVGQKLVEGGDGTLAAGAAGQPAFTVINLAGEVEMNRVALEVGNQKGKLRVVALKDDGTPDLSSGRVITEFELDGSKNTVSADVSDVKVKRVAIVWVPETPNQPLQLTNVGLFTSKPEPIAQLPEVRAIQQAAPPPAPAPTPAPAAAPTPAPATPAPAAAPSTGGSGAPAAGSTSSSSAPVSTPAATPAAPTPAATPAATPPAASANFSSTAAGAAATPAVPATPVTATPGATPATPAIPPQTRNVSR